ncbi:MAG: T9SS type A sorting domain-containing protein [Bacteroidia bacterium]|nr:T9SS type A sorting domain-containing protein [Bacteroidia bacterium]
MHMKVKHFFSALVLVILTGNLASGQYTGTGSVTQGLATTTTTNLLNCGRVAGIGTITATDNTVWTVPAVVHYADNNYPFASDMYNPCTMVQYATSSAAVAALDPADIVEVDAGGEVITAFVFADNYFEMYINGVFVGKDNVPFTDFNSDIVQFRVNPPFTIAMLLVDWEENLGLGSENNAGFSYHPGDGGMVAVFKNAAGDIIATTGSEWKAQTYYTAPITDLTCPTESGTQRLSNNCSTAGTNNGSNYYGLHWARPADWEKENFNDASWPAAHIYTNNEIGVNNKSAYTNFTDIFDASANDAEFIWSSNVILDNEVLVRYTVTSTTIGIGEDLQEQKFELFPNPARGQVKIRLDADQQAGTISFFNTLGTKVLQQPLRGPEQTVELGQLPPGAYIVEIRLENGATGYQKMLKL